MESSTCPECSQLLSERGFFCPNCGAQAKCRACRAILEPGAIVCVECGTRLDEQQPTRGATHIRNGAVNSIRLEETRTSRSFEARFTDGAVDSLSTPIAAILGRGISNPNKPTRAGFLSGQGSTPEPIALSDEVPDDDDVIDVDPASVTNSPAQLDTVKDSDRDRLHRLFDFQGEQLTLKDSRIKAVGKGDFVERLSCLFLYGHEVAGRPDVPRLALTAALTDAGVFDGHARSWIANTNHLIRNDNAGLLRLSVPGREKAIETLNRIDDPSITVTWTLGTVSRRKKTRADSEAGAETPGSGKQGKRKQPGASKTVSEWFSLWASSGAPHVDAFSLLRDRSVADKGLFGLWAIRCATQDKVKVVSRLHLSEFIERAFEIKTNDRTLEKALKESETAKGKVMNTGGSTKFQINPAGITYIEEMIGPDVSSIKWGSADDMGSEGQP